MNTEHRIRIKMFQFTFTLGILFALIPFSDLNSQSRGLRTINEKELRYHLEFLAAPEFRGRETPSPELEIASLYLANWVKYAGLKPLFEGGSYYQSVPVTVTGVFQPGTTVRITGSGSERIFYYGKDMGGSFSSDGSFYGGVVFAGAGISDPSQNWDDLRDLDLRGKAVLILDEQIPGTVIPYYRRLYQRVAGLRNRGAAAVLSVITPERNSKGTGVFNKLPSGGMGTVFDSQRTTFEEVIREKPSSQVSRPNPPFIQAEVSHAVAAEILGVPEKEISGMFDAIRNGRQVQSYEIHGIRIQLDIRVDTYKSFSNNVAGLVEGSDPVLKNEYVVVSGHHDHLGLREGEVIPGADDNGTATAALLEIAEALVAEKPKRSVIIAWFTGEEKGLHGSHYFVNNCPVPVEKISACLNMDMIGSNNPDSLYLVAPDLLSSELDGTINKVNSTPGIKFAFDYRYSNLTHPQGVYFRSDHYPFIRFGIPSVWIFSGFTPVYHTPEDVISLIDFGKFTRVTKLVYLTAFDIANKKELLKLDVNPAVKSRGKHNVKEESLFRRTVK